ncbi:ATP-binding protein [Bergeyella porcorum]
MAAEIIAMSNSKGGRIIFGVEDKTGQIIGLDYEQIQNYSNKLANIANDRIKPQVFIQTEVVSVDNNKILIVEIDEGIAKPYKDRNGIIG